VASHSCTLFLYSSFSTLSRDGFYPSLVYYALSGLRVFILMKDGFHPSLIYYALSDRFSPIPFILRPFGRVSPIPFILRPFGRVSPIPFIFRPFRAECNYINERRVSPIPFIFRPFRAECNYITASSFFASSLLNDATPFCSTKSL